MTFVDHVSDPDGLKTGTPAVMLGVAHASSYVLRAPQRPACSSIITLGSGEFRKSTKVKQMKIIHQNSYTPDGHRPSSLSNR
jgi:hypothetical protein